MTEPKAETELVLLVNFGDNDFSRTWELVLQCVLHAWKWQGWGLQHTALHGAPKKGWLTVLNMLVYPCYLLAQGMDVKISDGVNEGTRDYLMLSADRLFVGEAAKREVLRLEEEGCWWNYEVVVVVDTRLDFPGNSPVWVR